MYQKMVMMVTLHLLRCVSVSVYVAAFVGANLHMNCGKVCWD